MGPFMLITQVFDSRIVDFSWFAHYTVYGFGFGFGFGIFVARVQGLGFRV